MVQPDPYGHGVDEQSDHRFDAGELWRTSGNGRTEDHILARGRVGQDERPGHLNDRVEGRLV